MNQKTNPIETLRREGGSAIAPIRWKAWTLELLDQRRIPWEESWVPLRSTQEVKDAIQQMVVRGAPAIGIAAAFGMVLSACEYSKRQETDIEEWLKKAGENLVSARPTAVNLSWAIKRMLKKARRCLQEDEGVERIPYVLEEEALAIWQEDIASNIAMGRHGAELLPKDGAVLTHCNAGALATGGYGTALGVVRAAHFLGKGVRVIADETRPWLQGIRLTAWELMKDGIPVEVICDNAAGLYMKKGEINCVIVGADRIAANGDVANKIGTYQVALLARAHGIPFYVAAPFSTIDPGMPSGESIPIEERSQSEITSIGETNFGPVNVKARNPVFDVTPGDLVTAIITEKGVLTPPYKEGIKRFA